MLKQLLERTPKDMKAFPGLREKASVEPVEEKQTKTKAKAVEVSAPSVTDAGKKRGRPKKQVI